jgi:uncharacterized protein (UPF0332 family)
MTSYLDRAFQAAESARRDRASGDNNAACNRAYYAVFYAVLGLFEVEGDQNPGKTHASLLRKFSERFVLAGKAPAELGRALGVSQNLRSKGDYTLEGASDADAADAIEAMDKMLRFAQSRLEQDLKGKS